MRKVVVVLYSSEIVSVRTCVMKQNKLFTSY